MGACPPVQRDRSRTPSPLKNLGIEEVRKEEHSAPEPPRYPPLYQDRPLDRDRPSIKPKILGLNADEQWEFRHSFSSCYVFVKFLTGRSIMVGINDAMRIKDFKVIVMHSIQEKGVNWPYDEMPRLVYSGRCLQTLPDDMFLTCTYQNLWTEAVLHALPPANAAPPANDGWWQSNDDEEEEGEDEEKSEEEGQAE